MDCGSFTKAVIEVVQENSELFYIRAQHCIFTHRQKTETAPKIPILPVTQMIIDICRPSKKQQRR